MNYPAAVPSPRKRRSISPRPADVNAPSGQSPEYSTVLDHDRAKSLHDTTAALDRELRRPPETDIASRAYELFVSRGREDGHDLDDWLEAERQLSS